MSYLGPLTGLSAGKKLVGAHYKKPFYLYFSRPPTTKPTFVFCRKTSPMLPGIVSRTPSIWHADNIYPAAAAAAAAASVVSGAALLRSNFPWLMRGNILMTSSPPYFELRYAELLQERGTTLAEALTALKAGLPKNAVLVGQNIAKVRAQHQRRAGGRLARVHARAYCSQLSCTYPFLLR